MKERKPYIFVLIAALFVFTYQATIYQWNLGMTIDWSADRNWLTFVWPLWYIIVFVFYQRMAIKNKPVSAPFFWSHVLFSALPALLLNYPFKRWILQKTIAAGNLFSFIFITNWMTLAYLMIQVIFAILIVLKILKSRSV